MKWEVIRGTKLRPFLLLALLFSDAVITSQTSTTSPDPRPHAETTPSSQLDTTTLIGIIFCVAVFVTVVCILIVFYLMWRKRKNEATQTLQLTKYYPDVKDQMPASMYVFERRTWTEYLQFLQQKELEQLKPYEPLQRLLQDQENTLDFVRLKREAARLIAVDTNTAWRRGLKATKTENAILVDYLCRIRDLESEIKDEMEGGLIVVKGCRYPKIQNRRETQVLLVGTIWEPDCLHMTKLRDYYGFPIILCQAPVKKQFAAHWEAIWQEMVGVVVWIGTLVEDGERKIDEYISLTEGGKCSCGPFHIRTTLAAKVRGGYDAYRILVKKGEESRELVFVHMHMWPDHDVPSEPANLADLVWQVQGHQLRQTEKGLPCLMVHCMLGVQRSPAMAAAYIGRQMWMANKKVNVLGILRYIRRHRWKAFSMGNPFAQVQIIFGVLQVIATRSQLEGINPLQADARERKIFDHSARRADAFLKSKSVSIELGHTV